MDQAKSPVTNLFKDLSVRYDLSCLNAVDAGKVISHPFLDTIGSIVPVEAKQAWTDVAQLTSLGICAFNFGPGRQDQAISKRICYTIGYVCLRAITINYYWRKNNVLFSWL